MLRLHRLHLENYRCFAGLDLSFEPDVTVLFAENGGGKTALLTALAMGLALLQPQHPKDLDVDAVRDTRRVRGAGDRWEPAGPCTLEWAASIGTQTDVVWKVTVSPTSSRQQPRIGGASRAIRASPQARRAVAAHRLLRHGARPRQTPAAQEAGRAPGSIGGLHRLPRPVGPGHPPARLAPRRGHRERDSTGSARACAPPRGRRAERPRARDAGGFGHVVRHCPRHPHDPLRHGLRGELGRAVRRLPHLHEPGRRHRAPRGHPQRPGRRRRSAPRRGRGPRRRD